jgi:3-methyladenine DNA glycosylase Tag
LWLGETRRTSSLDDYLEIMSKAIFQSGISWKVVEAKWPGIRAAFIDFSIKEVAAFSDLDIEALVEDSRVIRNGRKLAAIVGIARRMIELDGEYGSFQRFLRSQGNFGETLAALHKNFKFMGPSGSYDFLYVVGEEVPSHEEFEATYRK